jgi:hypothetical protein
MRPDRTDVHPLDGTHAAQLERMALTARRARGDTCPECNDAPWLPPGSDTVAPCPLCGHHVGTTAPAHELPRTNPTTTTAGLEAARTQLETRR